MKVSLLDINKVAKEQIDQIEKKCSEVNPLVAINCITYNHEAYLRETLDGFIMQKTDFPFVVIVHDDASTDGTAKIIREYAEKYPDIILPIYETENQYSKRDGSVGRIMHKARNATGAKYVAMCEGDDYWTDSAKLQKQVNALEAHPEYTIVVHRVCAVDRTQNLLAWSMPPKDKYVTGEVCLDELIKSEFREGCWTFQTSSFLYRAELSSEMVKLRSTVFKKFPYGDMPLLLTCLLKGKAYFFTEVMSHYRALSGGYNSTLKSDPLLAAEKDRKVAEALKDFDNYTNRCYTKDLNIAQNRYAYWAICKEHDFSYQMLQLRFVTYYKEILFRFVKFKTPWIFFIVPVYKRRGKKVSRRN